MIEGSNGYYTLECDVCGADCKDNPFDSFGEAVQFKKDPANRWTSKRKDGDWYDICPDCKGAIQ